MQVISLNVETRIDTLERLVREIQVVQKGVQRITGGWDGEHLVVRKITLTGGLVPASMADASAENGTIYFSTTANKLVYKDAGGVVNNLY